MDLALSSMHRQASSELMARLETFHRLDEKAAQQMGVKSSERHVRTRYYFTSESHIRALLNVFYIIYIKYIQHIYITYIHTEHIHIHT